MKSNPPYELPTRANSAPVQCTGKQKCFFVALVLEALQTALFATLVCVMSADRKKAALKMLPALRLLLTFSASVL